MRLVLIQTIENKVINRVYGHGRGWCFTPNSFLDLGSYDAIRQSLKRLESKGTIRRVARGLYDYPKTHMSLGQLPPNISKAADALALSAGIKIQPTGAYAANLLGLSEHVPAKVVFLTDGVSKSVTVGNTQIRFKNTTPKNMKLAGTKAGLLIQAFKFLGKDHIDNQLVQRAWEDLNDTDKSLLLKNLSAAPMWIAQLLRDVSLEVA